ncbi:MAG: Ig-like domain-containing protein [Candidatus Cloacimonetes bacterium]|nr:Ig-like domain-containing protein [Candidatus Cloacimonadota bacterium]
MKRITLISVLFLILIMQGCGSKKSPTGGEIDAIKPEVVSSQPDIMGQIEGGIIEIDFSKPMDKSSVSNSVFIYPPVINKRISLSRSTLKIELKEALKDNTIYHVSLSSALKDLRGNGLAHSQSFAFKNGNPAATSLSGLIKYELSEDAELPVNLTVFTEDSLMVSLGKIEGQSYSLSNLMPANYLLRAYIDKNQNGRYDETREPFFQQVATLSGKNNLDIELAYADTTFAQIKSIKQVSPHELLVQLSKEVTDIRYIDIQGEEEDISVNILRKHIDKDRLYLLTAKQDTLSYTLRAHGLMDAKGNLSPMSSLGFKVSSTDDNTAPHIVSHSPRNGATVHSLKPEIKLTFSEIITEANLHAKIVVTETNREIKLKVLSIKGREITLIPESDLDNYRSHKLIVSKETKDYAQNTMEQDFESIFLPIKR